MAVPGESSLQPWALLCDVDGVLRHYDPADTDRLEADSGLAPGTINAAAFEQNLMDQVITGRLTEPEWRQAIVAGLAGSLGSWSAARQTVQRWLSPGILDHQAMETLAIASRIAPVVLVTNGCTRTESDLSALGALDCVTAVVNSARIGIAKPHPAIYRHAAAVAGTSRRRCVFVDDTYENVVAAHALGMTVIHYRSPVDLTDAVDQLATHIAADTSGLCD